MTGALKSTTVESKHLQIFTRPSLPIRYGELNDSWLTRHVRNGSCDTSTAMSRGGAELYER